MKKDAEPEAEIAKWMQRESLLTENEAAELLNLTNRALQSWRYQGKGPPFVRLSARCVRYRFIDITAWIAKHLRRSTSDPGLAEKSTDV